MAKALKLLFVLFALSAVFSCSNTTIHTKAYKICFHAALNQWDVTKKSVVPINKGTSFLKESASLYQLRIYDEKSNNLINYAIPDLVVQTSDTIVVYIPYSDEYKTAIVQMMDGSSGHYTFKKQNQLVQFSLKDESY